MPERDKSSRIFKDAILNCREVINSANANDT